MYEGGSSCGMAGGGECWIWVMGRVFRDGLQPVANLQEVP